MRDIEAYEVRNGTVFSLTSRDSGYEFLIQIEGGDIYWAMNIAENVTLHYQNGDYEYTGMSLSEALYEEYEKQDFTVSIYERS